jgi:hypothetical protein
MSRFTNLAIVLSLAGCEHASPSSPPPQFPERPVEVPPSEPATVAPEPAPVAETPSTAPAIAPVATPPKKLKKSCNPMSRAGCRWVEDTDERELPRVIKKDVP